MNKASGGHGIPAELFLIPKDDAVKVLQSICPANLENSAVATGLEKVSFHSNPKERQCQRMLKLLHNCTHLTRWQSSVQNFSFPSQASTVCEPRTFHMFKLDLEKTKEPELKLSTFVGSY